MRKLQDPYLKAIRWATDRIGIEGIVCFVTNDSFVDDHSLDGVRASLEWEFDHVYVLDLGGNVRKNPKLSGTTHNVFGIQVGVSINVLVRKTGGSKDTCCPVDYAAVGPNWRKQLKYDFLNTHGSVDLVDWQRIAPDEHHTWLTQGLRSDFAAFAPIAGRQDRIFNEHSLGISTNRDSVVYGFQSKDLAVRVREFLEAYAAELGRFQRNGEPTDLDKFLEHSSLKWSRNLKRHFRGGDVVEFDHANLRHVTYRPFTLESLYLSDVVVDEPSRTADYFPKSQEQNDNRMLAITDLAGRSPFSVLATSTPVDLHLCAASDGFQCFPFYTYAQDGSDRRENITDWALEQFRAHYHDPSISKWDIFYYIYAVLHHPEYRERYAANLRRELPRIPFLSADTGVSDGARAFPDFVKAGARLAEIHVYYEKQSEYPLTKTEKAGEKLDWRVSKMRLSKDKASLIYNRFLTLSGIPPETYDYRLGNRSALEWVIDQYQVSIDKRSGITNDPNRADDPQYILHLVGQVITVSLETVKIVKSLPNCLVS